MIDRTNEVWLADLTSPVQEVQAAAIHDLQTRLQRGIYYYLSRERSDLSKFAPEDILQLAQDFTQDAILRVLDNLGSFRGDSQFTTWATKVAMRVAISELRRVQYKNLSLDTLTEEGESQAVSQATSVTGTHTPRPETMVERSEVLDKVNTALNEILTPRQRVALEALMINEQSFESVADQLETNRNALYKLVHDARYKLRAHLTERGLSPEYILNLFDR